MEIGWSVVTLKFAATSLPICPAGRVQLAIPPATAPPTVDGNVAQSVSPPTGAEVKFCACAEFAINCKSKAADRIVRIT